MATHLLTAPEKKDVTRWLFDPSDKEDAKSSLHFNRRTGQWRDRGYKKWQPVCTLVDVDDNGNEGYRRELVMAPSDGYVQDLPSKKRYFKPGDTIATFEEGNVYHWRFFDQKDRRGARVRAVTYHKYPRVFYGLELGIAILIAVVGYLLTLVGWELPTAVGILMLLVSVPFGLISGWFTILGKERGYRFGEIWFNFRPFWSALYGAIGLVFMFAMGHRLIVGDGFSFSILGEGLLTVMAFDSMLAGSWCGGPLLSRFTKFVLKRIFKQKMNGADA